MKTKSLIKLPAFAALAAAASLTFTSAFAQENISGDLFAGWAVNSLVNGGGAPPAPFSATSGDGNVTIGPLMKGSGIGAITTSGVYGGANWTNAGFADNEANSIANGLYLTYTVKANSGYTISFTTNILYFHNSATGPISGELQYSPDGVTYVDVSPITYSATHAAQTTAVTNVLSGVSALQNVTSATTNFFRIVNWGANGTAGTWYVNNPAPVTMPDLQIIGTISSAGVAPFNVAISPSGSQTVNAGATVAYTVTAQGDLPTYYWYQVANSITNFLPSATTATLTLPGVNGANSGTYYAVLSNNTGMATSPIVSLTVIDPYITNSPASTYALLDGVAQFSVGAAGTSLQYQWYFSDALGNITAPVQNITQLSGSVFSGATLSTLTLSNVQLADVTNFVVVVSNSFNTATSSVASIIAVSTHEPLVFWNFNQLSFTNTLPNPAPWFGVGTSSAFGSISVPGTSPFAGSVDPNDGPGFGLGVTNFSWGTEDYPNSSSNNVASSNKLNGIQFNVSTVGAQNITLSYDSRVSATASDYERVQYTTNGTTWIDYPASSTFGGVGTTYVAYTNNLTGFPGAANNPSFGLRIVTETANTATYGISTNVGYLGTANTYGSGGTITYDRVTIYGDAITNTYAPPTISAIANTNTSDIVPITINFTVTDPTQSPDTMNYTLAALNSSTVNPGYVFGGLGNNRTVQINPNSTPDNMDAGPILITATDSNGFSAASWFILTLTSPNLPPTNSLTSTNTVANTPVTIPFKVTDDRTPTNGQNFSYSASSANNTIVPNGNIAVPPTATNNNVSLTITPAANQLGIGLLSVAVNDNDLLDPKTTTTVFPFMVRPNTNIVFVDYFNYDAGSSSLDQAASNIWTHLSGTARQMAVSVSPTGGYVTVDTLDNAENLQTALLGAPFKTNSGGSLYASFIVNMDPMKMPSSNGTYFVTYNDGSGTTGNYEGKVLSATNGAASGFYRLGICNFGSDATDGQMFPMDLTPGSNYMVVTALALSNGFSTIWVSPTNHSSLSVMDTSPASGTNLFNISDFEFRESGTFGGSVRVSHLKIGTTFDSVFPSLKIVEAGTNVVVTSSDPTLGIQAAPVVTGPYSDVSSSTPYTNGAGTNATFYRFGQ